MVVNEIEVLLFFFEKHMCTKSKCTVFIRPTFATVNDGCANTIYLGLFHRGGAAMPIQRSDVEHVYMMHLCYSFCMALNEVSKGRMGLTWIPTRSEKNI